MRRLRILFLLQDVPYPPSDGMRWKVYNLIKYLVQNHECYILSFGGVDAVQRAKELSQTVPGICVVDVIPRPTGATLWARKLGNILRTLPPSMADYESRTFAVTFEKAICEGNCDVVHYDIINMAQYLPLGLSKPSVHSPNDATSLSYSRMIAQNRNPLRKAYLLLCAALLKKFERKVYPQFSKVHVVSPVDRDYLLSVNGEIDVETIPVVVDERFIAFSLRRTGKDRNREDSPKILFSGALNVPGIANGLLEFLKHSYPIVLRACPNTQLIVLGRNAPRSLRHYVGTFASVKYLSWVEDYVAFLGTADVIVVPDKSGTGIKNRVLQAMALARPVVGSPIALEGISMKNGVHGFECSTPESFAQAIITLLKDEEMRNTMGRAARQLILQRYTIETTGPKWVDLYRHAIEKFQRQRSY